MTNRTLAIIACTLLALLLVRQELRMDMIEDKLDDIIQVKVNDSVKTEGILVPIAAISSNQWQKYPVAGILKVTKMEKLWYKLLIWLI